MNDVPSETSAEPVLLELGRAVYLFQAIELRLKLVLPHLAIAGTGNVPEGEGWGGRSKYFESKEMLGNLIKELQTRVAVHDAAKLEEEWRAAVQARNEVVHHFASQPFARCKTPEDVAASIRYLRARALCAMPLFEVLDALALGFVASLRLPPDFQGDIPSSLLQQASGNSAAY